MNKDYPPFPLISPEIVQRRPEIRPIPYPIETLQRRQEISAALLNQITPLSDELRQLSDEERKAIFFKLEHEVGIDLVGTDLKRVAQLNETTTLVIPKSSNLDKLAGKIEGFSNGEIRQGHVKNERLAIPLKQIEKGEPKDRLSPFLIENYNKLVKQAWVICEVEIFTFASGRNQQIIEIQNILTALVRAFSNGIHGTLFEQETVHRTVRAVIRCTGQLFKKLVEDDFWQTKIWYFEERPEFETFTSVLRDFNVTNLGKILSPDDSAPTVCIVDSGITIGNPFLRPVTDNSLLHSFLREAPDNPSDEHGHGFAVASLAALHSRNCYR